MLIVVENCRLFVTFLWGYVSIFVLFFFGDVHMHHTHWKTGPLLCIQDYILTDIQYTYGHKTILSVHFGPADPSPYFPTPSSQPGQQKHSKWTTKYLLFPLHTSTAPQNSTGIHSWKPSCPMPVLGAETRYYGIVHLTRNFISRNTAWLTWFPTWFLSYSWKRGTPSYYTTTTELASFIWMSKKVKKRLWVNLPMK